MVSIEELKLGNETLEALKFLLSQITELETAISQIDISEIKDANTLTKEQIATLQDVKNAVESINIELSSKKSDFDEKKQNFDTNMNAFRNDKADFDEKKADFDSKNNTALSNFAFIASNVEKINKISDLLAEAKNVLETIKPIEQRTQAALNTIANSQAKFDELDALKATLLELKRSLENISTTGLINDNSASTTATYSSQKLDTLLSKKLDVSDKEAMFSNGKIKAEILPDIDATTLNGKRADEFELNTESTTKYNALSQNIGILEGSLSTLTNALGNKIDTSLKGVANGMATLDNGGKLESTQIPSHVVLNNDDKLIKEEVEPRDDKLIKAINNRLTAINVANLSSATIDFSSGINFTILKANLAGDGAITISALNSQNNKAKSGMIFIEHSIAGFDASFTLTNPDDFETKQKALFNYYISPIKGRVYLFFVANVGM